VSGTIHVLGEGGGIFEMSLPLHPSIQARFDAGDIVQVNPDGSPYTEEAPRPRRRRAKDTPEESPGD
jgi:hypothetical protein